MDDSDFDIYPRGDTCCCKLFDIKHGAFIVLVAEIVALCLCSMSIALYAIGHGQAPNIWIWTSIAAVAIIVFAGIIGLAWMGLKDESPSLLIPHLVAQVVLLTVLFAYVVTLTACVLLGGDRLKALLLWVFVPEITLEESIETRANISIALGVVWFIVLCWWFAVERGAYVALVDATAEYQPIAGNEYGNATAPPMHIESINIYDQSPPPYR